MNPLKSVPFWAGCGGLVCAIMTCRMGTTPTPYFKITAVILNASLIGAVVGCWIRDRVASFK